MVQNPDWMWAADQADIEVDLSAIDLDEPSFNADMDLARSLTS